MRCYKKFFSRRLAAPPTLLLQLALLAIMPALESQSVRAQASDVVNPRSFLNSLSPSERKLPQQVLMQQRLAQGKSVPPGWERAAQARSRSAGAEYYVYRLDGESLEALETVLEQIGATVIARSSSRSYVTAKLTEDQVIGASLYAAVHSIRYVKGSTAQGVTQAWQAHRVDGMDGAGEPDTVANKPALSGEGVVIGIISKTITQADLTALKDISNGASGDEEACVIPPIHLATPSASCPSPGTGTLYTLSSQLLGTALVDENDDAIPELISDDGVLDGLNMLQVMYDIAPGADFVIASPGDADTPASMAQVVTKLTQGNNLLDGDGQPNTTASDYIPAANIIVDDLDFLTQNPFEIDEVSEAIVAARFAGALYVTAAGDGGHFESSVSTSNVFVGNINSQPPPNRNGIYDYLFPSANLNQFPGGLNYLTLTEELSDVCLFWNEDPGAQTTPDLQLLIFPTEVSDDWNYIQASTPGGCFSQQFGPDAVPILPVGTKLIIEDYANSSTDRFMIVGERSDPAIVDSSQEDDISATFDLTTPGAIRGHAYHAEALTIGATPWVLDPEGGAQAFNIESLTLAVHDYSADGESASQPRYFWENVSQTATEEWQEIVSGGVSVAKPDLTATAKISIKNPSGSTVFYHGTSASAAAAAAVSALYWDFRQWQVDENENLTEVSDEDIFAVVRASTIDINDPALELQVGEGVLDAPKGLEVALPASQASLTETAPGVVTLNFARAINDLAGLFTYTVSCTGDSGLPSSVEIEPADPVNDDPAVANAPQQYNVAPGGIVSCDITSAREGSNTEDCGDSCVATVIESVEGVTPPLLTMTARSAGVRMRFQASASESETAVTYTASCTAGGSPYSQEWTDKVVTPEQDYDFKVNGGVVVSCDLTASAARYEPPGDSSGTAADPVTETVSASATAAVPGATSFTVIAASGGVRVVWSVDPNLIDSTMATVTVNCSQGGTSLFSPPSKSFTGSGGTFVEADTSAPVVCEAVTTIVVPGGTTYTSNPTSRSATPEPEEEFESTGLPVWLLYVATQPKTVTDDNPAVGIGDQTTEVTVSSSQSLGQTFTAAVSGQLTSITIYVQGASTSTSADLSLEVRSATDGVPAEDALATKTILNGDVPARNESLTSTTVTFSSPATVVAGEEYAFLLQTSDIAGYDLWYNADDYADGIALKDIGNGWEDLLDVDSISIDFSFQVITTYTQ